MNDDLKKEVVVGPAIVAAANAMRAFDAPMRYPMLLSNYPSEATLPNALKFSGFSSFVVLVEHLIGVIILIPLIMLIRGPKQLLKKARTFQSREWLSIAFISLGSGLGLYFFLIALTMGNPTVAILLQKSQPLITLLVAMFLLKERPTRFYYVAAVFAVIGILLLAFEDILNAELFEVAAAVASLIAASLWGANTVFGRIMTDKVDYWDLTAYRYLGGSVILVIFNFIAFAYTPENFNVLTQTFTTFAPMYGEDALLALAIPMAGILIILLAAVFTGGIFPLTIYYFGLRWSKASVAGLAELAFPLLAVFVNFVFLGWSLSPTQIIGAVILVGVITYLSYVNRKEYEKAPGSVPESG
ncbi:MAG: DMT family transporter [Candidatus Odinarchaeota archaeon]